MEVAERSRENRNAVNKDDQMAAVVRDSNQDEEQKMGRSCVQQIKDVVQRFLQDLATPRLLVLKIIYFTLLAGVVILWPQFTLHQAALGLTVAQTGICSAVLAGVSIVVPFLSGVLGDKMGNYRILLIIFTLLAAVAAFLFSVVPSARIPSTSVTTDYTTTIPATTADVTTAVPTLLNNASSSSSLDPVDDARLKLTFWIYLGVRVAYGALQAISYTLFEAAVMAEVQATGVDYGFQRAWGTLAVLGASLLSGYLVELTAGFSILFYVSTALQLVAAVFMFFLRLEFKPPATSLTTNILKNIANAEVVMFFTAMVFAGIFFGFLETYMYRYLVDLGASPVLVGLTVTVGAPFEMVLTLLASCLVPLIGHAPIIMFGLLAHAVRLLGFSFLVDPWWVIPLEILESVSNGLLSTVGVMYCTVLFSLESIASFRGIFAVVYFGVGQLIGAASGSWLIEVLGDRGAFRALACFAFACGLTYGAAYYALMKSRKRKEKTELSMENDQVNNAQPPLSVSNFETQKEGFDNIAWVADE